MKEVDCRQCKNLIDTEKGCKLYGKNADEAVKKCADNNFRQHRKKSKKTEPKYTRWVDTSFGGEI